MRMTHMKVAPWNGQVMLFVPDTEEEPPQWPTGRELVVANSGYIYVATIPDIEGEVEIEVWRGELPDKQQEPIYDGTLEVRDAGAFVGNYQSDHLGHLDLLREGAHRVRVYTDPPSPIAATCVTFVID